MRWSDGGLDGGGGEWAGARAMRVVVVTREGRDYSRGVNEWVAEFERRTGRTLEMINPDSREGVSFAGLYGVVEYPSILALGNDGRVMNSWRGAVLPTFDEVSFYARGD